jgi:alkanesulfonate monooxygenase SsuD/methylene tetrahydromethanopterin reductase-like flavin-dependent oxidoreductase (luciferase family)
MFMIRLAMRTDSKATESAADYYQAALDMATYVDRHGTIGISIPQHHGSPDGYLPSPVVLATALATRTEHTSIMVMALLLLHYDPVKLAEDMAVLDLISRGRVSYVIGLGYRPEERTMFDVDTARLGPAMEESIGILRQAWTGEPFDHPTRGRMVVTPKPHTPGGPALSYGGHSLAAARRAARHGMALIAETSSTELEQAYNDEARRCGVEPVGCLMTAPGSPTSLFVAEDVDRAWSEIGPYLLHDAKGYGAWSAGRPASSIASLSGSVTVDELRAEEGSYRIVTPDEARKRVQAGEILILDPLCGGLPPKVAWPYLEAAVDAATPSPTGSKEQ